MAHYQHRAVASVLFCCFPMACSKTALEAHPGAEGHGGVTADATGSSVGSGGTPSTSTPSSTSRPGPSGTASAQAANTGIAESAAAPSSANSGFVATTAVATTGASTTGASTTTGGPPGPLDPLGQACLGQPLPADDDCLSPPFEPEPTPLELVMMVDASTSMLDNEVDGVTRWDFVSGALREFIVSTSEPSVSISLDYFSWVQAASCDIAPYAEPDVPMAALETSADELIASLEAQVPGGLTPTSSALSGAIEYASQRADQFPERQVAVVFITDGYPTRCDPLDIPDIAALAAAAWNHMPRIPVFLITLDGRYNLDSIARSGGTRQAYAIENTGDSSELLQVLEEIAVSLRQCQVLPPSPPEGQSIDPELARLFTTRPDGHQEQIPRVSGFESCNSETGGWYPEGEAPFRRIVVCPCSCAHLQEGTTEVALICSN